MEPANARRCLLISRPPVVGYPPALYQAELLANEGYHVLVADTGSTAEFRTVIQDEEICHRPLLANGRADSLRQRLQRMLAFRRAAFRLVRALRPAVTIAYEVEACAAVRHAPRRAGGLLAWHFHEMWEPGGNSIATNVALRYVRKNVALPDAIIIPDKRRADTFMRETGIPPSRVFVVMNCPRRNPAITAAREPALSEIGTAKLIVYNGSVGPNHGLETAIQSSVQWPSDARFVIKGNARPSYDEALAKLACDLGVSDKVMRIPFSPGFSDYGQAKVGWTVLEPVSQNWRFSAGASNKRYECMAAGTPQITDDTDCVEALITKVGCGLCIPPLSVERATAAVNRLLNDETLRRQMGELGRRAHMERFNYETQFEPVLKWLRAALFGGRDTASSAPTIVPEYLP